MISTFHPSFRLSHSLPFFYSSIFPCHPFFLYFTSPLYSVFFTDRPSEVVASPTTVLQRMSYDTLDTGWLCGRCKLEKRSRERPWILGTVTKTDTTITLKNFVLTVEMRNLINAKVNYRDRDRGRLSIQKLRVI